MSEESCGCGCCPDCTGEPDCDCCPDCTCGEYYEECGDDCCCGDRSFILSAVSSIVGMLFLGTLALLYGLNFMNAVWGTPAVVAADMTFLLFCIAGIIAFIGIIALKAGDMTEGILFALVGISALAANGAVLFGFGAVEFIDWVVTVLLFVVALILFLGRDITFGISVVLLAAGSAFATLLTDGDLGPTVACIAYLAGGIILLYVAISDWLFVETGADLPIL